MDVIQQLQLLIQYALVAVLVGLVVGCGSWWCGVVLKYAAVELRRRLSFWALLLLLPFTDGIWVFASEKQSGGTNDVEQTGGGTNSPSTLLSTLHFTLSTLHSLHSLHSTSSGGIA